MEATSQGKEEFLNCEHTRVKHRGAASSSITPRCGAQWRYLRIGDEFRATIPGEWYEGDCTVRKKGRAGMEGRESEGRAGVGPPGWHPTRATHPIPVRRGGARRTILALVVVFVVIVVVDISVVVFVAAGGGRRRRRRRRRWRRRSTLGRRG